MPRTSDDKYFLRMLLHHQKGSTSFEDLRTVDGQLYPTNKAAAGALGLLSDDKEIEYAMGETWTFGSSAKLRSLFAILLNYSEISSPQPIYDMFKANMMDDLRAVSYTPLSLPTIREVLVLVVYLLYNAKNIVMSTSRLPAKCSKRID